MDVKLNKRSHFLPSRLMNIALLAKRKKQALQGQKLKVANPRVPLKI